MKRSDSKTKFFTPGPTRLPDPVVERAQDELLSYRGSGNSVLEMSHRSADYTLIHEGTEAQVRELLEVPADYAVLFLQGGATGQFAAVAMNLMARRPGLTADYVVSGSWSAKAAAEASKYGEVREVFPRKSEFCEVPPESEWQLNPKASYMYYCANETIHGLELPVPHTATVPLVCDASSWLLSRPIDLRQFGLLFASGQKNLGCAGVTLVLVRRDLLACEVSQTPSVMSYRLQAAAGSLLNTPPTFAVYLMGLMLGWVSDQGGLQAIAARNDDKAALLYDCIDRSAGFYRCPVVERLRSRVNVVFRILAGDHNLEMALIHFAQAQHSIEEIKGHRSVGGVRVSLYNAIEPAAVSALVCCLDEFRVKHLGSN